MTGRECLLAALRRQQPERVPMPLRMPKFLRKRRPDLERVIERYLWAHQKYGTDIWYDAAPVPRPCFQPIATPWREDVTVEMCEEVRGNKRYCERTIHTPEGDLHDVKRALIVTNGSGDGPEVVEPLVKDLRRDIPLLRYMHPDPGPDCTAHLREAEALVGDTGLVLASLYSPIDCREALTHEDFLMLSHDDPGAFREIVAISAEALMRETEAALACGVAAAQVWWFCASPSAGWSPHAYDEFFLPWAIRHVELVHRYGAFYIYYDDGKMGRFLERYVATGADALMTLNPPPMGDADPATMKSCYGDRICLMGGIDAVNEVYLSTPERIREMVRKRLAIYKPGGGYIMDGSNSLVFETPVENVRALADAGREFGRYDA